ncbi:MAG: hypothetical protein F4178_14280 [Rhodospirillaceae bacterium]|nr:hypothetical protein [Rhodospirillaceae bacterium]
MTRRDSGPATAGATLGERTAVLAGFALAALGTAPAALLEAGVEAVAALWLAAAAWAFVASLVLALRKGLRHRDWRAFGRYEITDGTELVDWSTKSGSWLEMALDEENERLMRGD